MSTREVHPLEDWKRVPSWDNILSTNILDLLDPDSDIARQYPYLHEVLSDRYSRVTNARNGEVVSRCDELFPTETSGEVRADSHDFQTHLSNIGVPEFGGVMDTVRYRRDNMCSVMTERMQPYAAIGGGTYGTVFLAREPVKQEDPNRPARYKYYAIKVETHWSMANRAGTGDRYPSMTVIQDMDDYYRYIPYEALLLFLVSNSDRFPALDSVYVDNKLHSFVMSACIDHGMLCLEPEELAQERVIAFTGSHLTHKKKPVLNELQCCKVASQLLEGFTYLRDMNVSYGDLSKSNFLVDENLNATLIDLGMTTFAFREQDSGRNDWAHVNQQEHLLTPEVALELSKPYWKNHDRNNVQTDVSISHDTRNAHLWRLAALTYEMLHGYAPWETPEWDRSLGRIDDPDRNDAQWQAAYERRDRVINEELPFDENLSQDCVDALQMMLQKKPWDRATLEEMCAMPWFGQWAYRADMLFSRPYSEAYCIHKLARGIPVQLPADA